MDSVVTGSTRRTTGRASISKAWAVARLSLANLALAWAVTAAFLALFTIPSVIQVVQAGPEEYFEDSYLISSGNACLFLLLVAPVVVAVSHRARVMHLNAAKVDFLTGSLLLYVLLAAVVSASNLAIHHTLNRSWAQTFQVVNLAETFGWTSSGVVIGFVQQLVFLVALGIGVHALASVQNTWRGWLADLVLIATFSASLAAEPVAAVRRWLLDLLLFHSQALVQIGACMLAVVALYGVARFSLQRRET